MGWGYQRAGRGLRSFLGTIPAQGGTTDRIWPEMEPRHRYELSFSPETFSCAVRRELDVGVRGRGSALLLIVPFDDLLAGALTKPNTLFESRL